MPAVPEDQEVVGRRRSRTRPTPRSDDTCPDLGPQRALGGIRTPNLLIRSCACYIQQRPSAPTPSRFTLEWFHRCPLVAGSFAQLVVKLVVKREVCQPRRG